jgi:hypothetical protein
MTKGEIVMISPINISEHFFEQWQVRRISLEPKFRLRCPPSHPEL